MFKSIKDNWKKAEAAVIIENLLQLQIESCIFETSSNVKDIANKMVQQAWDLKPDLLGGRFGTRPHKLTVAAFTVASSSVSSSNGTSDSSLDFPNENVCFIMFGTLMNEVDVNGRLYNLTETDNVLLELALQTISPIMDKINSSPLNSEIESMMEGFDDTTYTWDEWYKVFVSNACAVEGSGLVQDEDGLSLIDLMDHEPLKMAHRDGICPINHGVYFAKEFDINKFGVR